MKKLRKCVTCPAMIEESKVLCQNCEDKQRHWKEEKYSYKEDDVLVYERGEDKCTFLYRRTLAGGFLDSVVGSNSYYLEHGKFLQQHFDAAYCRLATDAEKMEYFKLKINSHYQ